jgi:hypothetical protein
MSHRIARAFVLVAVATSAAACGSSNPAQPSSGSGTLTPSILAPRPLTPNNSAQVRYGEQPVTLAVQNALSTRPGVTYTFEIAADAAFTTKVQTKDGVAEGNAGQTSVKLDALDGAKDYYWHARASGGGTTGVFGAAYKFTVGPAIVISAPTPVTPLNGTTTSGWPTFTVIDAARSGPAAPLVYRFDIATSADFSTIAVTGTVPETPNQTSFTPPSSQPPAQTALVWRAVALDPVNAAASPASAVQSFTYSLPSSAAARIAAQEGIALWPGTQPPGTNGQAVMGDNWQVQILHHNPTDTFFKSPTAEMLRFFDLFDRGLDPQSAINWMNGNGYPTGAQWYPPPEKGVLGLQFTYLAARNKVLVHGTWDIVLKLE